VTETLIANPEEALGNLTDKQVEVLDLLVHHHTTKQIARELDIAPNTVDQRLKAVRDKWGTRDRNETARLYALFLEACGKHPCGFQVIDQPDRIDQLHFRDLPRSSVFELADARALEHWYGADRSWSGLETFDARFGKLGRVGAIIGLAAVIAVTVVAALAMAQALGKYL
jgi:DNA-binding CsgD family transcriptional regulator